MRLHTRALQHRPDLVHHQRVPQAQQAVGFQENVCAPASCGQDAKRRQEYRRGSLENPFAGTGTGGGQKRPEESGRGRPEGLRHVDGARVFMEFCGPAGAPWIQARVPWHECPRHGYNSELM